MLSLCVRLKSEKGSVVAKFQTCEPERLEDSYVYSPTFFSTCWL